MLPTWIVWDKASTPEDKWLIDVFDVCIILIAIVAALLFVFFSDAPQPNIAIPFKVEMFWEEYGPIILDNFLAFPLVRMFRVLYTRISNSMIRGNTRASFPGLPDELLLEICYFLRLSECPSSRAGGNYQCHGCRPSRIALLNLSQTNKRMRTLMVPMVLDNITLRRKWRRTGRAIRTAQNSMHAPFCVSSFAVDMDVYNRAGGDVLGSPPRRLLANLAKLLPTMRKLEHLTLVGPEEQHEGRFRQAFTAQNLLLPTVRTLTLGPHMDWIIAMCPNVETISTSYRWRYSSPNDNATAALIISAGWAQKLRHFEMHISWDRDHLRAIQNSMPDLRSLGMQGDMGYAEHYTEMLPALSRFQNLKTLVLEDAAGLDVGYHPPTCGNPYLEPGGDQLRESLARREREAEQEVAETVFGVLKGLEELWMGGFAKAVVERDAMMKVVGKISWSYGARRS